MSTTSVASATLLSALPTRLPTRADWEATASLSVEELAAISAAAHLRAGSAYLWHCLAVARFKERWETLSGESTTDWAAEARRIFGYRQSKLYGQAALIHRYLAWHGAITDPEREMAAMLSDRQLRVLERVSEQRFSSAMEAAIHYIAETGRAEPEGLAGRLQEGGLIAVQPEQKHARIQWLLLSLGHDMGYDVWVARDDRSKGWATHKFSDISLPHIPRLVELSGNERAQGTVERIDVLWLRKGSIQAAFEVENTTPVYSGLLRMSDLLTLVPNLSIQLYVVAPSNRRSLVMREINRPTFSERKLPNKCRLITFEHLTEEIKRLGDATAHLADSYLRSISESCQLPEGDTSTLEED